MMSRLAFQVGSQQAVEARDCGLLGGLRAAVPLGEKSMKMRSSPSSFFERAPLSDQTLASFGSVQASSRPFTTAVGLPFVPSAFITPPTTLTLRRQPGWLGSSYSPVNTLDRPVRADTAFAARGEASVTAAAPKAPAIASRRVVTPEPRDRAEEPARRQASTTWYLSVGRRAAEGAEKAPAGRAPGGKAGEGQRSQHSGVGGEGGECKEASCPRTLIVPSFIPQTEQKS